MTPDQPITLFFAIFGSILTIALPLRFAMAPLVWSMFLWPSTINVPPTEMQLSLSRVLVIVLLCRCLGNVSVRSSFKWGWADTGAAMYYLSTVVARMTTARDYGEVINNRLGFFLSAMAPFWCARLLLTDRQRLYCLFKAILWPAAVLALEGLSEMVTGYNPWLWLSKYSPLWIKFGGERISTRQFLGGTYTRATGPFVQCIMFGWFFALIMGPFTNLFFEKKRLAPWIFPWLVLPIGIISSIAAGPMSMAAITVFLICLFPLRRYWKIGVIVVLVAFGILSVGSNRSPMEIIANFGFDASSSWFRVGLLKYTINGPGMAGHWLFGYGVIPPSYDKYHDLCIHWIAIVVIEGMVGVIGFHAMVLSVGVPLARARSRAVSTRDQWLLWSFMCTVVASLVAIQLVDLFAEMYFIYLMFLGIIANAPFLVGGGQTMRQVGVLADLNGKQVLLRYTLAPGQRLALVSPATPGTPANPGPKPGA